MTPVFLTGDIGVNKDTISDQSAPNVAALADNRLVAVWIDSSTSSTAGTGTLRSSFIGPNGEIPSFGAGPQFSISPRATDPVVTALPNGSYVVAWRDLSGAFGTIKSQQFDQYGTAVGGTKLLYTDSYSTQIGNSYSKFADNVSIAGMSDGGYAVAFNEKTSHSGLYSTSFLGAIFDAKGSLINSIFETGSDNTVYLQYTVPLDVSLTSFPGGGFSMTYDKVVSQPGGGLGTTLYTKIYNTNGQVSAASAVMSSSAITDHNPSVTATGNGYTITWNDTGDVYARNYTSLGIATGSSYLVNTLTSGNQFNPAVVKLADGTLAYAWQDDSGSAPGGSAFDAYGYGVKARASSEEFLVNQFTAGNQSNVALGGLADGSLAFVWTDDSHQAALNSDPSGTGIKVRIVHMYDHVVTGVSAPTFQLFSSAGGNTYSVVASSGDDKVAFGPGGDRFDGGAGIDTYSHGGGFKFTDLNWDIRDFGARVTVSGYGDTDTLINVERLQFADGIINRDDGSALFDTIYYYSQNKDVWRAQSVAVTHYDDYGWHEGRNPNASFSTIGYLAANADVVKAGLNPLTHFDQYGWKEGRDPGASFDNELYLLHNADVKAAGLDPLVHYLQFGKGEGRQAYTAIGKAADLATHPGFDAEYYLLSNQDVAKAAIAAGGDSFAFAYNHYETNGWHEGRNPNAVFDTKGYLATYNDVKNANIDPLAHYDSFGFKEDRDPSANFDTKAYESRYVDVANAGIDPMLHYLQYGVLEGRTAFNDGHFG